MSGFDTASKDSRGLVFACVAKVSGFRTLTLAVFCGTACLCCGLVRLEAARYRDVRCSGRAG